MEVLMKIRIKINQMSNFRKIYDIILSYHEERELWTQDFISFLILILNKLFFLLNQFFFLTTNYLNKNFYSVL